MKKYTFFAYIILLIFILLIIIFGYKIVKGKSSKTNINDKIISEINYIESNFLDIFNKLNNISFDTYKVISKDVKESQEDEKEENAENKQYSMESNNLLKNQENQGNKEKNGAQENAEIDWDDIQNKCQNIYKIISILTIDAYQTDINKEKIINFSNEYDVFVQNVKNKEKQNCLEKLSQLYDMLVDFLIDCEDNNEKKVVAKVKKNVFKVYSILDKEDWNKMASYINDAATELTNIMTDVDIAKIKEKTNSQYEINKAYIMLNEVQTAIKLKDKDIFLIKYKNVLEELENM